MCSSLIRAGPFDPCVEYVPWLWLAIVSPGAGPSRDARRLGKSLLVAIAALQTLHAYPVAGTHVRWATFLFIPAGALAIGDGWAAVRDAAEGWAVPASVAAVIEGAGALALVAWVAWFSAYAPLRAAMASYEARVPLGFPGTERIHVAAADAKVYQWLVGELGTRCTSFITMPGLNSLYLFSGIDPPTRQNVGAWPTLFDIAKQRMIRDRFAAAPGPSCAIRNVRMATRWLQGRKPGETPLADYIAEHFVTVARRPAPDWLGGEYEFMVERTDSRPE